MATLFATTQIRSVLALAGAMAWPSLLAVACDDDEETTEAAPTASATENVPLLEAAGKEDPAEAAPQKRGEAKKAGERVEIPAGEVVAGSTPGDRRRDPSLEPPDLEVELDAFEIDKLPYPNDPDEEPLTGVARKKAAELCEQRDGRLCNELEWERACKGPEGDRYAGGQVFDSECAEKPETCASGFGVLAMGGAMREWTASDIAPIENVVPNGAAAVRGASAKAADVDHRCAHRSAVAPTSSSEDVGFRCCYGPAPDASIPSPEWLGTVRKVDMPPEKLAELFESSERLAPLAKDIKYFHEGPAADTVMRRGRARGTDAGSVPSNTEMTTAPFLWNPAPGEEILVVTGRAGEDDSFIAAFHELPDGRYRVGAAMHMKNEVGPVVIVYNPYVRRKMHWTTCWECRGQTGRITYRSENRVAITQE